MMGGLTEDSIMEVEKILSHLPGGSSTLEPADRALKKEIGPRGYSDPALGLYKCI